MKLELQDKLYEKYPALFGQKDLPMTQTAMCWGIDTGDGWYNIIDCLCSAIDEHVEQLKEQQAKSGEPPDPDSYEIQFVQVKEKFGTLRAYLNYSDETLEALVGMAARLSARTCDQCGNPAKTASQHGWYQTLCPTCAETYARKTGIGMDPVEEDE